ncbi:MAG: TolC family protein, partial [Synergistaceae bacterium]|nr:TolC family protein [Synergistaceae bacterium]
MKNFKSKPLLLILFVLFALCRSAAGESVPLTLDKALKLAEKNNPVLSAGRERIAQGKARLDQATAAGIPDLAVSLLYQETGEDPLHPVFIEGSQVGFARAGFQSTWKAALSLSHVLYSGGAIRFNEKAKKAALEGIVAQEERTRQSVLWSVQSSWYELLRAKSRLYVAEEVRALASEHLRQVKILLKNGAVAYSEVLRVEVSVSEAELNRIKAKNAVDVAWQALERAVGVSLQSVLSVSSDEMERGFPPLPENPLSFALQFRPEMKALDRAMNSALFSSRAASALGGPRIILSGEVYAADEVLFPSKMEDWRVTLAASW